MEVVLTRLRDFSRRTSTFDDNKQEEQRLWRDPESQTPHLRGGGGRLDIESALAWLRMELMEMRSQDQALIRQLMELHSSIQELSQELSEEEEEGSSWDSGSEDGSGSFIFGGFCQKTPRPLYSRGLPGKALHRRSSVP